MERWFTWRQQVKPISPVTVANYRGAIDRYILPALGRAKVREVDAATLDALYARVRAHGGRCRACWQRIRRGEAPLLRRSWQAVNTTLEGLVSMLAPSPSGMTAEPSCGRAQQ